MDPYKFVPSESFDAEVWTTNYGAPVTNATSSLSVGSRGPLLLEDYHLIEKLAQFDRERIPERVVHAVGGSAKGYFECTADISHLTKLDCFREVGAKTPVIVRFSTVVHARGSPETLRDPRGFAVKFYTREGNWDLVGNNMPVFFIRDGIKFPDLVHAFKPDPATNQQELWRILDFLSHHPESSHMLSFLMDDVGIPLDYRHMPGFGVHTYKFMNHANKATYVKFHWKPTCGEESLLDEDAVIVGGTNHQHAQLDLFNAIEEGDYPEWIMYIQTMEIEEEDKLDWDPLDVTKTWPEDQFPLLEVGRMVLNQNPETFFTENEMLAFCPSIMPPGIYPSEDKLLQTRLFSYTDTQRHRLGPNYLLIPVNAPKCRYHNNHFDGFMNPTRRSKEVNYFPSSFDKAREAPSDVFPVPREKVVGRRVREVIKKENNFFQAGDRFRSWDRDRQDRFIGRIAPGLADPRTKEEVRKKWLGFWAECDRDLGRRMSSAVEALMK